MADINTILAERGSNYGAFKDLAEISRYLKGIMRGAPNWVNLEADQMEALDMVQHKIARILNGDPNYIDSWSDIAGYATLVEKRLSGIIV